jgi:fucose permease
VKVVGRRNAFDILKQTFEEYLYKTNFNLILVLDVFMCYYFLYSLIMV